MAPYTEPTITWETLFKEPPLISYRKGEMYGEQGFIAVRETVHLVKFIGIGCSIFFLSAYVALLMDIKY